MGIIRSLLYSLASAMAVPTKSMKGMKSMKATKGVIARGRVAKSMVLSGKKVKTVGGLTQDKLVKNKNGKVVSKAYSARSKKQFVKNGLGKWNAALKQAKKALNLTGFVLIGGKTAKGK